MSERRNVFISIDEWEYKKNAGSSYTGYVIGLGYAYVTYRSISRKYQNDQSSKVYQSLVPLKLNNNDTISPYLQYDFIVEQCIDTSETAVRNSFSPMDSVSNNGGSFDEDTKTVLSGVQNPTIAGQIGKFELDCNNNSTSVVNIQEDNTDISQRRFSALVQADPIVDLLNRFSKGTAINVMAIAVLDEFYKSGFYTGQKAPDGTIYIDRTKITVQQYEQLKAAYERFNLLDRTV